MEGKMKLILVSLVSFLSITVFCFAENTQVQSSAVPKTETAVKGAETAKKTTEKSNIQTRTKPAKCDKVKKAMWSGTCAKTKTVDKEVKGAKKEAPKQNIQPLKAETKTETATKVK